MVGKGVLLECLDSPKVASVLIVNRSSINIQHLKLKELLIKDFFDLADIEYEFDGYNACFFCLGTSAAGKSEEEYQKNTYDLTLNFAKTILKHNSAMTFCYVSGTGTDSNEKSSMMWARVKGRTENSLLKLSFKGAYMFRPGYIQPLRGTKTKLKAYQVFYTILRPFYSIFKHFPIFFTDTINIGRAMIDTAVKEPELNILYNKDINELAKK
jgi:hypothetical protein